MRKQRTTSCRAAIALTTAVGLVIAGGAAAAGPLPQSAHAASAADVNIPLASHGERLRTILERFDAAQLGIRTLRADFSEKKELAMLVDTLESAGRFYYASPDRAKWEYLQPDERIFLINGNTLMQYFPEAKTLEKKDLRSAYTNRLFKLLGLGQSSTELAQLYDIDLGDSGTRSETYLLVLTPRKKKLEKRISQVLLWVGNEDFLVRAMEYRETDGDTTHIEFTNLGVNLKLADGTFNLDIPEDVEIHDRLSIFSDAEASR